MPPVRRRRSISPCSAGALSISPRATAVVDAGQILHHQPARADVEMADLGISHLSRGQADVRVRRCAGKRADSPPTSGRTWACAPAGWRCRQHRRASPSRRARPASPDGASASQRSPCVSRRRSCRRPSRIGEEGCVGSRLHRQPRCAARDAPKLGLNHRAWTVRVFGVTRRQILHAQQVNFADAHQCAAAIR